MHPGSMLGLMLLRQPVGDNKSYRVLCVAIWDAVSLSSFTWVQAVSTAQAAVVSTEKFVPTAANMFRKSVSHTVAMLSLDTPPRGTYPYYRNVGENLVSLTQWWRVVSQQHGCQLEVPLPHLPPSTQPHLAPAGLQAACFCALCPQYFLAMRHGPVEVCRLIKDMDDMDLEGLDAACAIVDVWATLQGQQLQDEGRACSSGGSAAGLRLPMVQQQLSQRRGICVTITLREGAATTRLGGSRAERWRLAAAGCLESGGLPGHLKLECSWAPLSELVQEQLLAEGADHAALGAAWLSLVLRVLGSRERLQRHGRLYACMKIPATARSSEFRSLSTVFDPEALKRKP